MAKFILFLGVGLWASFAQAEPNCQTAQSYLNQGEFYAARDSYREYLKNRLTGNDVVKDPDCGTGFYKKLRKDWYRSVLNQSLNLCSEAENTGRFAEFTGRWDSNLAKLEWLRPDTLLVSGQEKQLQKCKAQWREWLDGKELYLEESSGLEIVLSNCYQGLESLDSASGTFRMTQAETSLRVAKVTMKLMSRPMEVLSIKEPYLSSLRVLRAETDHCLNLLAEGIYSSNH